MKISAYIFIRLSAKANAQSLSGAAHNRDNHFGFRLNYGVASAGSLNREVARVTRRKPPPTHSRSGQCAG